jgi:hypothetical protein
MCVVCVVCVVCVAPPGWPWPAPGSCLPLLSSLHTGNQVAVRSLRMRDTRTRLLVTSIPRTRGSRSDAKLLDRLLLLHKHALPLQRGAMQRGAMQHAARGDAAREGVRGHIRRGRSCHVREATGPAPCPFINRLPFTVYPSPQDNIQHPPRSVVKIDERLRSQKPDLDPAASDDEVGLRFFFFNFQK